MILTIIVGIVMLPLFISELIYFDDKSLLRITSMILLMIGNIFFDYVIIFFRRGQLGKMMLMWLPAMLFTILSVCLCLYLLGYLPL